MKPCQSLHGSMGKVAEIDEIEDLIKQVRDEPDLIDEHKECGDGVVKLLWDVLQSVLSGNVELERNKTYMHELRELAGKSHEHMSEAHHKGTERRWRRLYTDCMLLIAFLTVRLFDCNGDGSKSVGEAIKDLDMAIIIAGAPGNDRMDIIQNTIKILQQHLPYPQSFSKRNLNKPKSNIQAFELFTAAKNSIPTLNEVPDMEEFLSLCHSSPYLIPKGALGWPTFQQQDNSDTLASWANMEYLLEVSGPGRFVPVEIGKNYLDKEWQQKIIPWEKFLLKIGWNDDDEELNREGQDNEDGDENRHLSIRYLAQYNVFDQFPQLRRDILFPDLLFSSASAPDYFPTYQPLIDLEDGMETFSLNAWLGPKSTVSPAHRDPHYNYYAQIVGQKLVWIAPPTEEIEKALRLQDGVSSQIDVFNDQVQIHSPDFAKIVQPKAMFTVLQPGDTLIMPPGWFHAFKSLTKSFSVSMWF